ncbi:MAG: hypothetical protein QXI12_02225 [Candidatus Methanomethyliaceae archaeon]
MEKALLLRQACRCSGYRQAAEEALARIKGNTQEEQLRRDGQERGMSVQVDGQLASLQTLV